MKKGRLTKQGENHRHKIEDILFTITSMEDQHAEIELRLRQAIQRSPHIGDVLDPALERLLTIQDCTRQAIQVLKKIWQQGQSGRWEDGEQDP